MAYIPLSAAAAAYIPLSAAAYIPLSACGGWRLPGVVISFTNYSYCFVFVIFFLELSLIIRFVFVFVIFFLELSLIIRLVFVFVIFFLELSLIIRFVFCYIFSWTFTNYSFCF